MGLIEEEIKEIRQLIRQFDAGKISIEYVQAKVNLYSQTERRIKMALQAFSLGAKYGTLYEKRLTQANLIGNTGQLDLIQDTPVDQQKIDCSAQNKEITREQCLDFSGNKKNYETCKDCEIGIGNKRMLSGSNK